MANIILTNSCNIRCPFCFASENNEQEAVVFDALKSWKISSFLTGKQFRFCGGEPSLTPNITEIADAILAADRNIMMMTNGIWPDTFRRYIEFLPYKYQVRFSYLFNILHPSFYKHEEFDKIQANLAIVNPQMTTLGFTIYKKDFDYQYLFDLAEKFQIKRLRWSVAAPNISNHIDFLEPEFHEIADRIYDMHELATQKDISLGGDCNYIQPCYYKPEQRAEMLVKNPMRFGCSGGSPVDIGPDGTAWRCYGLYSVLRKHIADFENERALEGYFTRRVRLLNNMYAYKECQDCSFWHKGCDGGCFVYRIKKAWQENPSLNLFPIDDDQDILRCRPYRSPDLVIKESDETTKVFRKEKLVIDEDENTISFLKEIDGQKSVGELIDLWINNFSSPESATRTVIDKCRELFEKDYIQINYDYRIEPKNRPSPLM